MSINEFTQAHKNRRRTCAMLALMQRGLRVECVNVAYNAIHMQLNRVGRAACIVNVLSYVNGEVPQVVACAMCERYSYSVCRKRLEIYCTRAIRESERKSICFIYY